jgi:hypothetical protein
MQNVVPLSMHSDFIQRRHGFRAPLTNSPFPGDAQAVIYQPAPSPMTSGRAHLAQWKLRFERRSAPYIEPLMGWTAGDDTLTQVELSFPSMGFGHCLRAQARPAIYRSRCSRAGKRTSSGFRQSPRRRRPRRRPATPAAGMGRTDAGTRGAPPGARSGDRSGRELPGICLNGGYGWLEIECCRCKTRASVPLDAIRRARDKPIWKLEPSFRCRSCGTPRYKPPEVTEQREITPYPWVHPERIVETTQVTPED